GEREYMADCEIKFTEAGQLKEKQYVIIEGVICKIDTIDRSKPGKHGAAKIRIVATGVFNDKKMNLLKPSSAEVEIPLMDKGNAQVIADLGEKYQVMDKESYQTLEVNKDEFPNLPAGAEIEYMKAGSEIKIVRVKS
ncbi:MAG: translation initiation factor IF-5A, partial [archaeon]